MKKLISIAAFGALAASAFCQLPNRVFSPWTSSNPQTWTFANPYPANASGTAYTFPMTTYINVDPYVFVGGLWDETVEVQGMGSGTSTPALNNIQILTNMSLIFAFTNFGAVTQGPGGSGTAVPGTDAVTVSYGFQLFNNWSTGTTIDNTGSASGAAVGAAASLSVTNSTPSPLTAGPLNLNLSDTTDGVAGLQVSRSVAVTGQLPGDRSYTSTGNVIVTIN